MVIEINKDIDRYKETVTMGLTAKQLIYSVASVAVGGGMVFLLYPYIGLTGAAYVAIPCVAPIALGGFYSYNGMGFYEYMGRKIYFMMKNKTLTYISTEGETAIKEYQQEIDTASKGKKKKKDAISSVQNEDKKQEAFEEMKKKTKRMLFCVIGVIAAAVAAAVVYKMHR